MGGNLRCLCEKCNKLENKYARDNREIVICVENYKLKMEYFVAT